MSKERPILFSAPMVRAILEGRKTVTRREVKKQAALDCLAAGFEPAFLALPGNSDLCPYGQPGDRLWVRESLRYDCEYGHYFAAGGPHGEEVYLCSLFDDDEAQTGYSYDGLLPERSVPSIHLHRRYSRILLEITDVRVERLLAGEGETAFESRYVAEGIYRIHHGDGDYYFHPFKSEPGPGNWCDPFDAWRELWVSINGADSWNSNPWVWVVEFKRVTP
jgi:hypothetical protein